MALTSEVSGEKSIAIVSVGGSCHDAAFLAHFRAARLARAQGIRTVTIHNSNLHVVNFLSRVWKARRPTMRRYCEAFERMFGGMTIIHRFLSW
jgi:hypothetical protein